MALTLDVYTLDDIAIHPGPVPSGYKIEPEHKDTWVREFAMSMPSCLPYTSDHSTVPLVQESRMRAPAMTAHAAREAFDTAINHACKTTLKPKRVPDPRGANWWSDECSTAHINARTTKGLECQKAFHHLRHTTQKAKCEWAHQKLHEATDEGDIWQITSARKGHITNTYPALQDSNDHLVTDPEGKAMLFKEQFFPTSP